MIWFPHVDNFGIWFDYRVTIKILACVIIENIQNFNFEGFDIWLDCIL